MPFKLMSADTSVFTTFYFGAITNKEAVTRGAAPHFQFLFRSSWGLSRPNLGRYNSFLRHGKWTHKPFDKNDREKRVGLISLSKLTRTEADGVVLDVRATALLDPTPFSAARPAALRRSDWARLPAPGVLRRKLEAIGHKLTFRTSSCGSRKL